MICLKCGDVLGDGAKFCPNCGTPVAGGGEGQAAPAPGAPSYTLIGPDATPGPDGRKRRTGLLIGGAVAAAALVVVLVMVAMGGLFASPKEQVEAAFAKTAAAYAGAGDALGLPDLDALIQGRSYSQRFDFRLNRINTEMMGDPSLSVLEGLGIRLNADLDQPDRKLGYEMAFFLKDRDMLTFQLLADDDVMSFALPQLLGDEALGFDTETLGADLKRMGAESDDMDLAQLGFNVFDLLETFTAGQQPSEDMTGAAERLVDAIIVVDAGKETIRVNGTDTDAAAYHVTVPKAAMEDYIDAMLDAMQMTDASSMMADILRAIGFDDATIGEMLSGMETTDVTEVYREAAEALKDSLEDLELDVYLSGGYICAVEYAGSVDGSTLEIGLYLGGGDSYVDDLSLEISVDGQGFVIESSGDHAGKSGVFTDETVFRIGSGLGRTALLTSTLSYDPKAGDGGLRWSIGMSGVSLDTVGSFTTGKDSVELRLDDMSLNAMGTELVSFGMGYRLGPCDDMTVSIPAPKMLADMDEAELIALAQRVEVNTEAWASEWEAVFQAGLAA